MDSQQILDALRGSVPEGAVEAAPAADGMPAIYIAREHVQAVCLALRELRWTGFMQLIVFFLILLAGYVYVWRKGVFNWGHEE